ncbi:TraB/VirB10 family protein [Geobacter sp. DSM 9736]|uniref:TraB/VirB10 family protein n=1 Tax=Geobacter sp. DSM 9736 TaxID=1277350 RepID=UPI000B50DC87|nr:TraB/VirB10 family protein [Geobacter sp. DSM 9736]SNB45425.1 conjugal transfer pilus assembly protein TraB [Geobacter sp. DSM 9736]
MKNRIKVFWSGLSSKRRKELAIAGVGCGLLFLSLLGYLVTRDRTASPAEAKKPSVLALEPKLLEKSQMLETQKELSQKDEELKKYKEQIEAIKAGAAILPGQPPVPAQPAVAQGETAQVKHGDASMGNKGIKNHPVIPPPPPALPNTPLPPPPPPPVPVHGADHAGLNAPPAETEIGDIAFVSSGVSPKTAQSEDKKKEPAALYLPPSFMEAILLSGLDAPTSSEAKGNPVPALLKVKTPAFLPNSVRADLKGCYVIADGKGNLATERAELLLVSLSCLDRKGRAVIDQKVKGFVVDQDSKIGLRGRVVAKMGSMIARSMIAGFFGGVGDVLKSSATTTAISPLGTTQTISPTDLAKAGVGNGLAAGFKDIEKFYMELAHQTMPVIEVSAAKPVTLVISEGVNLEIKKIRKGGVK